MNDPYTGTVRGEILLDKKVKEKYFPDMKNCRNAASGIMKHLDGADCDNKERVLAPLIFDHESKSRAAKYLQTLAVVPEGSAIITMLQSFAEIAFRTPSYSVVYTRDSGAKIESPSAPVLKNGDEILVKMREMERRYEFENEIMRSVKNGSHGTEEILRVAFTPDMFEQRLLDPLRNAKNYCIIMNTLLRKAAEEGGEMSIK